MTLGNVLAPPSYSYTDFFWEGRNPKYNCKEVAIITPMVMQSAFFKFQENWCNLLGLKRRQTAENLVNSYGITTIGFWVLKLSLNFYRVSIKCSRKKGSHEETVASCAMISVSNIATDSCNAFPVFRQLLRTLLQMIMTFDNLASKISKI